MNHIQFRRSVAKRKQQGGCSVMIWAGIVDQTNIEPFKVDEVF